MSTHYETLGLPVTASSAEIKKAHRRLALQWHPDKFPQEKYSEEDRAAAEAKFKVIQAAYDVLSDPETKKIYDLSISTAQSSPSNFYTRPQAQPQSSPFNFYTRPQAQPQSSPFNFYARPQAQPQSSPFNFNTRPQAQPQSSPFNFNTRPQATAYKGTDFFDFTGFDFTGFDFFENSFKPKPAASQKPKPFDWKTFVWRGASKVDQAKAMKGFADEVNNSSSSALKNKPIPAWVDFSVDIGLCESPPDDNGPYVDLVPWNNSTLPRVPIKLSSLLLYKNSLWYISKDKLLPILALLSENERYGFLFPADKSLNVSPGVDYIERFSEGRGERLLQLLSSLSRQHQILICKAYFESLGVRKATDLVGQLKKLRNPPSALGLCVAMIQIIQYIDDLKINSQVSADRQVKKDILKALLEKINSQEASLKNVYEALNDLGNAKLLKKPRHWWDPRAPKGYGFFNQFKVAVETLMPPVKPSLKQVLKKVVHSFDGDRWVHLSLQAKKQALEKFQAQVNNYKPSENEVILLPTWLTSCNYAYTSGHFFWEILPDKPALIKLCSGTKEKKLTFELNLNHLLHYRTKEGRNIFVDKRFDLILERIPESLRYPTLMQESLRYSNLVQTDQNHQTKLMGIFKSSYPFGEETTQRTLYLLSSKERLLAVHHIVTEIESYKWDYDVKMAHKSLHSLSTYLKKNAPDSSVFDLFKVMQKLIKYQAVLKHQLVKHPLDTLLFEKYTILKGVLEKIQDPQSSLETLQTDLAGILQKKNTILKTRRDWFNPSTPKTYSYLHELQDVLNTLDKPQKTNPYPNG